VDLVGPVVNVRRVFAIYSDITNLGYFLSHPVAWLAFAFQVWMFIDAVRRSEWIWAACIFFFTPLSALIYFFLVYRQAGPAGGGSGRSFEFPGASERRRIKELEGRIHHLDKARDHLDLADIRLAQGKFTLAETSYRESLARDPDDAEARAHLGECLLRQNRPQEALPWLQQVVTTDPKHDYGRTLMALAETQTALGDKESAFRSWQRVLASHSYPRARVQLAELLVERGDREAARRELSEVIEDDQHAPRFQRQREKPWVRRAQALLGRL
jgi:tetratricopeptide (TPR) repeat protein